jgi:hypothetical protein
MHPGVTKKKFKMMCNSLAMMCKREEYSVKCANGPPPMYTRTNHRHACSPALRGDFEPNYSCVAALTTSGPPVPRETSVPLVTTTSLKDDRWLEDSDKCFASTLGLCARNFNTPLVIQYFLCAPLEEQTVAIVRSVVDNDAAAPSFLWPYQSAAMSPQLPCMLQPLKVSQLG